MDIKIETSDNGGKFKTPIVEILTREMDENMSFYYSSLWPDSHGIQVNNEHVKKEILEICYEIDDLVRQLHDLINKR